MSHLSPVDDVDGTVTRRCYRKRCVNHVIGTLTMFVQSRSCCESLPVRFLPVLISFYVKIIIVASVKADQLVFPALLSGLITRPLQFSSNKRTLIRLTFGEDLQDLQTHCFC